MSFTDVFIRKPILAMVISLFILLLGLRSATELNVRQFPEVQNAVVSVTTAYIGADADLLQCFIAASMCRELVAAERIDYLISDSSAGMSNVQPYLRLDYGPTEARTLIAARVNAVRSDLPEYALDPVATLSV